ncbi:MAG TPA: hypothetical protein VKP30_04180, partial [Polyangiaceae bacterium]|nr:hypothetical protein [Polyangiaceae bacterium]
HCTHYSYPYSIDSNCFQYWPIGYSQWTTTQGGFRDSNHSVTQDVRTWNLWYQYADGTFCTNCVSGGGIGLYGSIGGSGGEYVEAACGIGPPPNSQYGYGYCMTYWHS